MEMGFGKMETTSWIYLYGMLSMLVMIGVILVNNKEINFFNLFGVLIGLIILTMVIQLIESRERK